MPGEGSGLVWKPDNCLFHDLLGHFIEICLAVFVVKQASS
jgi:hypothetical protein